MHTHLRRVEEKNKRYNEIIDAAEELILEKGIDELNMRDVANKTRLSVGAIYKYFESKEELVLRVSIEMLKNMIFLYKSQIDETKNAYNQLKIMFQAYIKFIRENYRYFKLVTELHTVKYKDIVNTKSYKEYIDCLGELSKIMISVIQKGKKDGSFKKDVDLTTFIALIMSIDAIVVDFNNRDYKNIIEDTYGITVDDLVNSYLNLVEKIIKSN